jgi:chemotaxis protein histidine kinase CheA
MPPRTPAAAAAPAAPASPVAAADSADWGRVTEDGTVEVREGDDWRVVGQYPDGTHDEALAYYVRKFDDLAFKVHTLEQRHQSGGASASDLTNQAQKLESEVTGAAAVGDLSSLHQRLAALTETLAEAREAEAKEAKELVDAAIAERTVIVESIEAIAARDLSKVQWKQVTEEVSTLFDTWQAHQQNGPRLPKGISQQLWKRFRDARAVVDKGRRAFYAELDETHKAARDRKNALIERAEALAPKGVDGIPAYRGLLDDWKGAGRAGRKADDALWARFKAAGDALYAARAEQSAAEEAESAPKIEARKALLEDAKAVADESNIKQARALLTKIQRQWDEVGRIFPREQERALDDKLRVIEQALKSREEVDWKRNNPETKARANDMSQQLQDAIEKLESELAAAEKSGDKKAAKDASDALEARRAWLSALGN